MGGGRETVWESGGKRASRAIRSASPRPLRRPSWSVPVQSRLRSAPLQPPDCYHTNSLYWDTDAGAVYLNIRNLHTFYLVNKTTNEIVWSLGRAGLVRVAGEGAAPKTDYHGFEALGRGRFLAFNNGVGVPFPVPRDAVPQSAL